MLRSVLRGLRQIPESRPQGLKAHIDFACFNAGDESPAYHTWEFFSETWDFSGSCKVLPFGKRTSVTGGSGAIGSGPAGCRHYLAKLMLDGYALVRSEVPRDAQRIVEQIFRHAMRLTSGGELGCGLKG
jgi:hypothetical protein